jgi:hypothetical protein
MTRVCLARFLLAFVLLLQLGCLTTRTLERAKPHNCEYASITEVTRAGISSSALFIEFQAKRMIQGERAPRVLRIPLNDSAWLHDKRGKPVIASKSLLDETQVHDVAEWFLLPATAFPSEAEELPILKIETDNLQSLPSHAAAVSGNVQVLSVNYTFVPNAVGSSSSENSVARNSLTEPVIAILSKPDASGWRTALVIARVCEGCEQSGAWYAMTPLAVLGDVVTFPFQAIAVLLWAAGE